LNFKKRIVSILTAVVMFTTAIFIPINVNAVTYGCDIAHYNGKVDMNMLKTEVSFVHIKATEGNHTIDKKFIENANNAVLSGIQFGFYHFFHIYGIDSAKKQADFFYDTIKDYKFNLTPVVDVEVTDTQDAPEIQTDLRAFITEFQSIAGYKPVIYTYTRFANRFLGGKFGDCNLWIARYGRSVGTVEGWNSYDEWQYSETGHLNAVDKGQNCVDLDIAYNDNIFIDNTKSSTTFIPIQSETNSDVYKINYTPVWNSIAKANFDVLDSNGNHIGNHEVYKNDKIHIINVKNGLAEIDYPTAKGWIHGYIHNREDLLSNRYYKKWRNGHTKELVYDANGKRIGSIFIKEYATYLYKQNGMYCVLYDTSKGSETKSGFVKYNGNLGK
jgi:lysozyme